MPEVDQRIVTAGEYLAGVEQTDVLHMPPSALLRECAESRRQLAALLGVLGERQARTRQLTRIRAVLDSFDWEFDDRQLALEEIGRIVAGGEQ
jgi:hypothetical protein